MRSRISRIASTTGLALAFLGACGCGQRHAVSPAGSSGVLPDQEVSDFVLTETDQGTPQWTLYARYAATYSARSTIKAQGVRVDFFDEHGRQNSELTAREGEINQMTRDMIARGHVVLQNVDGARMTTEHLKFLNQEQKIVTDDFVRVERAGDELSGTGFESDPQLRHFEFKTRVNATVRSNSGGLIESGGHP
ncbi:MAG: LPS export ABC transporter periplasmic protein LptC [Candidatus Eisenbacteria bacterium]|nr:LPS export ABC transporter periplasmic protein LptC [Candidatus Eisenbacteria bacterium]